MFRFASFELDERCAELREPSGEAIGSPPRTLAMQQGLVANVDRVPGEQGLMQAIWPSAFVGDDSLFQWVREIRAAPRPYERV